MVVAAEAVVDGLVDNAYALVAPPGHHATSTSSMGFCLFNNLAVAIRHRAGHAQRGPGSVIDWDVHHGNGTQEIFWSDPTVLTVSVHQDGLYPAESGAKVGGWRRRGRGTW